MLPCCYASSRGGSCPDCKVHRGFYKSWQSLESQTLRALSELGCGTGAISGCFGVGLARATYVLPAGNVDMCLQFSFQFSSLFHHLDCKLRILTKKVASPKNRFAARQAACIVREKVRRGQCASAATPWVGQWPCWLPSSCPSTSPSRQL